MMDQSLVDICLRLRASDASACTELFRLMHGSLLRYAARLMGDADPAYDVVQEAFIKLWERRHDLDPERSLRAYLFQIVRNTALNQLAARHRQDEGLPETELPADAPDAEDEIAADELGERINSWIGALPPRRREAFRLSRFEGLSHGEIAEVMGLSARTVTQHVMLALQYLRDRLRIYEAE